MKINIRNNIYNLNINDLVVIGHRANNPKRNFLFISKVLGKHIEVRADICKAIGFLLASILCTKNDETDNFIAYLSNEKSDIKDSFKKTYKYNEKITVLGFAETATGLGMAVASAIEDSYYMTTTREDIKQINSLLNFEEEHSHATTHKCFVSDKERLMSSDRIILVDDEITTGKSMLNIIKELKKVSGIKKYTILSILDWRNKEYLDLYKDFQLTEGVNINVLSLIDGNIINDDQTVFYDEEVNCIEAEQEVYNLNILQRKLFETSLGKESYIVNSGRFGTEFKDILKLEEECTKIASEIERKIGDYEKILVLGHGENIYIPSRVAAYLKGDVLFKSTTRSPIYCMDEKEYPIKEKHVFYDNKVKYYFYNKSEIEKEYDKVILLTENELSTKLTNNLFIFKL